MGPTGPAGPQGLAGARGVAGAAGAQGVIGPAGPAGPLGPAGADGALGLTGPPGPLGLTGPAGPPGPAGADGADGAPGVIGPAGADGAPGAVGPAGPPGPAGVDGVGPAGADGAPGAVGPAGPPGPAGTDGAPGLPGADGVDGAPGPAGGLSEYAYVYNTALQVVPLETDVAFDTNGVMTSGITHVGGAAGVTLVAAGDYKVTFSASGVGPTQMALFVNGAAVPGGVYGSGAGTQPNIGQAIITVPANAVLTLRNHSSAAAVALQTLAGGTQTNVNASLAIEKIG